MNELDLLKKDIYRKSGRVDYLTFEQFRNGDKVAMTRSEKDKNNLNKKKSRKRTGKWGGIHYINGMCKE